MLLNDAKSFAFNGKDVNELWFGGKNIWSNNAKPVIGTGGFEGKTWAQINQIVKDGNARKTFKYGDTVTIPLSKTLNDINHNGNGTPKPVDSLIFTVDRYRACDIPCSMALCLKWTGYDTTLRDLWNSADGLDTPTYALYYKNSKIKKNLDEIYNAFPEDLKKIIVAPTLKFRNHNSGGFEDESYKLNIFDYYGNIKCSHAVDRSNPQSVTSYDFWGSEAGKAGTGMNPNQGLVDIYSFDDTSGIFRQNGSTVINRYMYYLPEFIIGGQT